MYISIYIYTHIPTLIWLEQICIYIYMASSPSARRTCATHYSTVRICCSVCCSVWQCVALSPRVSYTALLQLRPTQYVYV